MELSEARLIVEVAEHGSLTRAAAARATTQSALSRQLARIEREWANRLFERTGRGLRLTGAGERILPRLKELLSRADELRSELRDEKRSLAGEVRIGLIPSIPQPIASVLFRQLKTRHPKLRMSLFEGSNGEIEEWLSSGQISIGAFFRHSARASRHTEEILSAVDAYLIGRAGDPLTSHATIDFSTLATVPLVLSRSPNGLRTKLEQIADRNGVELSIAMEANSLSVQQKLVADGCGYAVVSSYALDKNLAAHQLSAARIVNPPIKRYLTLGLSPKHQLNLAEREVATEIRKVLVKALSN
jgi:LysR family transcriptional regulator, nitrogen assimilation regulatory protein